MSDERQGDALWPALECLPRGSGVVIRHYSLAPAKRRALIEQARRIARRRGLVLVTAGPASLAIASKADGFHERSARIGPPGLLRTMSVHDACEVTLAGRARADLVFASPVLATKSHPGAPVLGRFGLARLVRKAKMPVVALGGMTKSKARGLRGLGNYGWAAVGALTPKIPRPR